MKKLVSILFATCMLLALSVVLTSCSHKASDTWSKDESEHWRTCLAFGGCKDNHEYERAEHTMSELTSLGPGQHSSECTVCGYEEKEDHSFDSGVITTEATKEADGVKTYTCKDCGFTKTEDVKYVPTKTVSASAFNGLMNLKDVTNYKITILGDEELTMSANPRVLQYIDGVVKNTDGVSYSIWKKTGNTGYAYSAFAGEWKTDNYIASHCDARINLMKNIVENIQWNKLSYSEDDGCYVGSNISVKLFKPSAHIFENMVEYDTTTFDTVEVYFEDGQLQKIWFTEAGKTMVVSVAYGEAEFTIPDAE